ncbi:MAG: BatA domain-containing protein [bacterium]
MIFTDPRYLFLLLLIPILIILLMYALMRRRGEYYSSLIYFRREKKQRGDLMRKLRKILKVILFILILTIIIMYTAGPGRRSSTVESVSIIMDNVIPLDSTVVQWSVDSLEEHYGPQKIDVIALDDIADNRESTDYEGILNAVFNYKRNLKAHSNKIIIITPRRLHSNNFADIITVPSSKKISIVSLKPHIVLLSKESGEYALELYNQKRLVLRKNVNLQKGLNTVDTPGTQFNRIIAGDDTIITDSVFSTGYMSADLQFPDRYIEEALEILSIENNEDADIKISLNRDIDRGIVYSLYGSGFASSAGEVIVRDTLLDLRSGAFSDLTVTRLDTMSGKSILADKNGNTLIAKCGEVYCVNIPMDTAYSNIVMLPVFIEMTDKMIRDLSGSYYDKSAGVRNKLKLRSDGVSSGAAVQSSESPVKSTGLRNIFIILLIILISLYLFI